MLSPPDGEDRVLIEETASPRLWKRDINIYPVLDQKNGEIQYAREDGNVAIRQPFVGIPRSRPVHCFDNRKKLNRNPTFELEDSLSLQSRALLTHS